MATAYLLASVLTLLVVLVQGQKAIHEQEIQVKTDKLVEVADDIFEDELNSDIDFLLFGSANTRAECNQKKKCKNKGGTCQNKGNACAGKSVKGCSKGCSCCLPEEIFCKPSQKCKRANGACISRSECNGKIIANGCKKPKRCKRTHVCCVQDEITTESPIIDLVDCPNDLFTERHVCMGCNRNTNNPRPAIQARNFVTDLNIDPGVINDYPVFFPRDYSGDAISYTLSGVNCKIQNHVMTYSCGRVEVIWTCILKGFCTAQSALDNGVYVPDSLKCPCPNPILEEKHICSDCHTNAQALNFTKVNRPTFNGPNTVLAGQRPGEKDFEYDKLNTNAEDIICKITKPISVTAWQVTKHNGVWDTVQILGTCNNLESALNSGHLFYERIKCYKEHSETKWGDGSNDGCITLQQIQIDETPEYCMEKCTQKADCNAFNYKFGDFCVLMTCDIPYPEPAPNSEYSAYYLFPVPAAAESVIEEE